MVGDTDGIRIEVYCIKVLLNDGLKTDSYTYKVDSPI